MEKVEGVYTYRCKACETVIGIVSRFGVSADCLNVIPCPKCRENAVLYGEGHMKHVIYQCFKKKTDESSKSDYSQYPITLNATHVSEILGISGRYAYELMDRTEFPTIKVGRSKRVNREDFIKWLDKRKK